MGGMVSNAINQSGLPNAINQAGFQQQLGRVSNQMYQPPSQMGGYDPYTAMRRPNYMPFGPNQQFYQPIYQPSYSQFSNFGYGQAPFGGFYQPPMMGFGMQRFQPQQFRPMLSPQPMQSQYRPIPYMTQSQIDTRNAAAAAAAAPPPNIYDGSGGGYGDGGVGGDGGGVGMGAGSTGEGVFKKGGNVDDGIASLLKK
jgi:hypothetical protein